MPDRVRRSTTTRRRYDSGHGDRMLCVQTLDTHPGSVNGARSDRGFGVARQLRVLAELQGPVCVAAGLRTGARIVVADQQREASKVFGGHSHL